MKPEGNILIPRIMFALSVVLIGLGIAIYQANLPSSYAPYFTPGDWFRATNPVLANTMAGMGIVGLIFLAIAWIWCLYLTYKRDQPGWRLALWFSFISAAIPVLLYLLLNPQE